MDEQARDEMVERITRVGMMLEDLSGLALSSAELDPEGLAALAAELGCKLRDILRILAERPT